MTTLSVYTQIRRHVETAHRLIALSNLDISYGGEDDPDAADHLKQAYEHLDAATALVAEHRPVVTYQTVRRGVLDALDAHAPTEWVRIWDERNGTHATVPWYQVEEAQA